jgi:hypothetical protein
VTKTGDRRFRIENAVAKMLGLYLKRFGEFNLRVEDIAAPIVKL